MAKTSKKTRSSSTRTKGDVLKIVKDRNIKFIKLWFLDILGQLKSVTITDRELERASDEGMGFDGSSIEGFARIYESDLVAVPDPSTFQILPWIQEKEGVARMFCDILSPEGKPYDGDTRFILKKNLAEVKRLGYTFYLGPELEYFYFKSDKCPEILDEGGYFDFMPLDEAHDLRRETILILEKMGIKVCQDTRRRGLILRPLGNCIVLMPPLIISKKQLKEILNITYEAIKTVTEK